MARLARRQQARGGHPDGRHHRLRQRRVRPHPLPAAGARGDRSTRSRRPRGEPPAAAARPRRSRSRSASLLASANATAAPRSRRNARPATAFEKGGPNKVGPDSVGRGRRPIASTRASAYSDGAEREARRELGLRPPQPLPDQPQGLRPRTKMTFAGLRKDRSAPTSSPTCARCPTTPCRCRRAATRASRRLQPSRARPAPYPPGLRRVRGAGASAGRRGGRGPAALLPHARDGRDQGRPEPGDHRRPRGRGARCAT